MLQVRSFAILHQGSLDFAPVFLFHSFWMMYIPGRQNHSWREYALPFEHVEYYISEDGLTFLEPKFHKRYSQKEFLI